jgi:heptosyltransferase-2
MKVLVTQLKMIGDVLMSTAICEAVKARFPHCELHYLIYPNTEAVTLHNPDIDRIIRFDTKTHKGFSGLRQLGKSLRAENYDIILDAYCKPESLIPIAFAGKTRKIGFKKSYSGLFYTDLVERKPGRNALQIRLDLAQALTETPYEMAFPKIYLSDEELNNARTRMAAFLTEGDVSVMVSIMGSSVSKSMPAKTMAQLMDRCAEQKAVKLFLNYMPLQAKEAAAILACCSPETQQKVVASFSPGSLREFLAALAGCRYLIGNEGGAVNMAKALGIPTFCVYAPFIGSGWNLLEETGQHVSVHLKSYRPDLYEKVSLKKIQKQFSDYYKELRFELFEDKLTSFLNQPTLNL